MLRSCTTSGYTSSLHSSFSCGWLGVFCQDPRMPWLIERELQWRLSVGWNLKSVSCGLYGLSR